MREVYKCRCVGEMPLYTQCFRPFPLIITPGTNILLTQLFLVLCTIYTCILEPPLLIRIRGVNCKSTRYKNKAECDSSRLWDGFSCEEFPFLIHCKAISTYITSPISDKSQYEPACFSLHAICYDFHALCKMIHMLWPSV